MTSRKLKMTLADAATPLFRLADPERAHAAALLALRRAFAVGAPPAPRPMLAARVFGLDFPHPIGVAAGFDKNAVAPDALLRAGAGFVEIGAVTPRPQAGNPKPRLFRLREDRAVINRMGFNNDGLEATAARLRARRDAGDAALGVVGANLGANKDAEDRMADFVAGLRGLWGLVDFFTVNVSSPNTERLRELQGGAALSALLGRVVAARDALAAETSRWAPVLVKIAPDLEAPALEAVAEAALGSGVDGAIVSNTTVSRPSSLKSAHASETGGLSGAPLFDMSTRALAAFARATDRRLPLIGVGGVSNADEAYAKIRAGACLVQLYSALTYAGLGLVDRIADGLETLLAKDGLADVSDAIGADL